jgi:hypothetical protein
MAPTVPWCPPAVVAVVMAMEDSARLRYHRPLHTPTTKRRATPKSQAPHSDPCRFSYLFLSLKAP